MFPQLLDQPHARRRGKEDHSRACRPIGPSPSRRSCGRRSSGLMCQLVPLLCRQSPVAKVLWVPANRVERQAVWQTPDLYNGPISVVAHGSSVPHLGGVYFEGVLTCEQCRRVYDGVNVPWAGSPGNKTLLKPCGVSRLPPPARMPLARIPPVASGPSPPGSFPGGSRAGGPLRLPARTSGAARRKLDTSPPLPRQSSSSERAHASVIVIIPRGLLLPQVLHLLQGACC